MKKAELNHSLVDQNLTDIEALPYPTWIFDILSGEILKENALAIRLKKDEIKRNTIDFFNETDLKRLEDQLRICPFFVETTKLTFGDQTYKGSVQYTRLDAKLILLSFYEFSENAFIEEDVEIHVLDFKLVEQKLVVLNEINPSWKGPKPHHTELENFFLEFGNSSEFFEYIRLKQGDDVSQSGVFKLGLRDDWHWAIEICAKNAKADFSHFKLIATSPNNKRKSPDLSISYFKDLFENATDLIQGIDRNGHLLYANKSWYETLGYDFNDHIKLSVYDIVLPEQREDYKLHLESVVRGEIDEPKLWTLVTYTGGKILVETNENLRLENGKPHSIRSIMRNVSATLDAELRAAKNKARIEAFFDSSNIIFWTVNQAKSLTSFNKKYGETIFNLYGIHPEINEDLNVPKKKFASDAYHDFWDEKYLGVFETGKSIFFQTLTKDNEGNQYHREIYLNPIRDKSNPSVIIEVAGIAIDITAKYVAEQKLIAQAEQIKTIFEASQLLMWTVNTDLVITSFNERFEKAIQERFSVKPRLQMSGVELASICELKTNGWREAINSVLKGEKYSFEHTMTDSNGQFHVEDVFLSPILNSRGDIEEIAIIAQTVTARKSAEKILKEQAGKINAIFDSTALYIYSLDREKRLVSFNKMFAQQHLALFGVDVSIGMNFIETSRNSAPPHRVEELDSLITSVFNGQTERFESKIVTPRGSIRWMENFYNPIYGENDEIKEISCLSFDITDKKETERSILESIKEKEVLLQEVHHRVKNNLQVINSMLNLQSSYVKEENSLTILKESQNRIKSMSFIHESLYMTTDFTQIEFGEYLLSLTKNLIHTYGLNTNMVDVQTDIDELYLSIDQAIPCGLIINEIVSNALKYAFIDREKGKIHLRLKIDEQAIGLEIGDDGPGLPEGFDYRQAESLGLQLIFTLIEQLDGSITLDNEGGTKYLINFDKQ